MASSLSTDARSQARALRALVMVSMVENVFDATTNMVVSGSRSTSAASSAALSMFDTKRTVRSVGARCRNALVAISGPRSEPPIPMLTTARMGFPVAPRHAPLRTWSATLAILASTAFTAGTTSSPSTTTGPSARSAVCRTDRSSVVLMRAPANIAWRRSSNPVASASPVRSAVVVSVTTCLEKSTRRSPTRTVSRSDRSGSSANSSRRFVLASSFW